MNRRTNTFAPHNRGFTLIELMVSLSIFSIIIVMVAGAYLKIVSVDRQTRTLNELVNNLSFVTDSMSRAIREGTNYCNVGSDCDGELTPPYNDFSFTDQNGCTVEYYLSSGQLVENDSGTGCPALTAEALTEPGITVTNVSFYVYGAGGGSNAFVTYILSGTMKADALHTEAFTIESSAAERTINL